MRLYDLKTMKMTNPVIDRSPYFSWKIASNRRNVVQERYEITVLKGEAVVWDSGIVASRKQGFIEYAGVKLESRSRYVWKVKVWDNTGEAAEGEACFETAFLEKKDWRAKWVECSFERQPVNEYRFGNSYAPILFEKEFKICKKVRKARIYASAHGIYRLCLNGERLDEREFAPEFTSYGKLLYYQVYDAAFLLKEENMLSMYVGDGWYFSAQAAPVMKERHKEPSVIAQIEVWYEDGTFEVIATDGSESCRESYIVYSDLYQGEKQDFTRNEMERKPVCVKEYGYDFLATQPMEPVVCVKELPAVEILTTPAGETVVDFGQIVTGRARVHIHVPGGEEVALEYFEVLNEKGNYINTMFAPQKDTIVSDGKEMLHEALFTFHGFRYIRVTGMAAPELSDFKAVVLSTRKENTGSFLCSDDRMNRLYQNVRWSQCNNMMSVPTDCPTREKAGWTGDILIYAKTALVNENVTPFLNSWLGSVRADQAEDGTVMIVSPYMKLYESLFLNVAKSFGDDQVTGVAGWSDAIVWVPYDVYRVTGNEIVLRENFKAMDKWCRYIITTARDKRGYQGIPIEKDQYLWNTGFHFGEWLVPSRPDNTGEQYGICKESAFYIAPFFGYMTMVKMSEICTVLKEEKKAEEYRLDADNMKKAIQEGILEAGLLPDYLMGAYVLAFAFDLVPDALYGAYKEKLLELIRNNHNCLDTGFLATPFILDVLCGLGEKETAYKILWQKERPSWLYEVDHGATAIWEAWDADDAKRTGRFVSFNHYAFGCVDDFIFRHIAGIDSEEPGFSHIVIRPDPDCGLAFCDRKFECEAGTIAVHWNREKLEVSIPCNTDATVYWKGKEHEIGSGSYVF